MHIKNKSQYFAALTFDNYVKFKALSLFFNQSFGFDARLSLDL